MSAECRERYQRYLNDRMPLEGLLPQHGDSCEFDHCVCALSERKETDDMATKSEQRAAKLARLQARHAEETAKTNIRLTLDEIRATLHQPGWPGKVRELCMHAFELSSVDEAAPAAESAAADPQLALDATVTETAPHA